jgi:hypothetical protein
MLVVKCARWGKTLDALLPADSITAAQRRVHARAADFGSPPVGGMAATLASCGGLEAAQPTTSRTATVRLTSEMVGRGHERHALKF